MALRSVNGNGTRTTSPWLKLVVDGILEVVPKFERRLGGFEPGDIRPAEFSDAPANREGAAFGPAHPSAQLLG